MENNNEEFSEEFAQSESSGGVTDKLKGYGKEAYKPIVSLVSKYQDEFTPYLEALSKGLQGGASALNGENGSDVEKYVSRFFTESANGINDACEKLKSKDISQFSQYITELVETRPSIMFGASYAAGIFFGRLGRHILQSSTNKDQSLH